MSDITNSNRTSSTKSNSNNANANKPLILAILTAIGASACCIGPLLLLSLGIGGAWVSNLTAMEPYSAYLTGLTLIILAVIFRRLYLTPQVCEGTDICSIPSVHRKQKILFWSVSIVLIAMMLFPYYANYVVG